MTSARLKIAIFTLIGILVFMALLIMESCNPNRKTGDYYYGLAMQSLAQDSIEDAFCQIDKALAIYGQEKNMEREADCRIILAMLYFSNNLKEGAYDIIKDLSISPNDTCNYLLKSNYFRIMAYYLSEVEKDHDKAIQSIDIVIKNDNLIDENSRKPHLLVDMLNKSEFLINAGKVDEAQDLITKISCLAIGDTTYFPQLYVNKARLMEAKGRTDSAYAYSDVVKSTTSKIYKDGENLLTALKIMMNIDSINGNLASYASHRNLYESILQNQIGDKAKLRMELLSNKNKMELTELNYAHEYQLYIMWTIITVCAFLLITLIFVSKYQVAKKQKLLIQLECEKLDAECFRRKLECELYSRKMKAKDDEMKKINQDLLDLSFKLANMDKSNPAESAAASKDHLSRLLHQVQIDHPGFSKRMTANYPAITKTELILAELIRLNLNTEEITSLLNITQAGLIKSRYRLRKRLGLATSAELDSFITSF